MGHLDKIVKLAKEIQEMPCNYDQELDKWYGKDKEIDWGVECFDEFIKVNGFTDIDEAREAWDEKQSKYIGL